MMHHSLVFGPFRLVPSQRMLLRAGKPVRLPSRAWEILKVLTHRAGELVTKRELMESVWFGSFVEEGTLRVHIARLRRILEDGSRGTRYVESVTGVGYRFVAPVSRVTPVLAARRTVADAQPSSAPRVLGRAEVISSTTRRLGERRLVTVVGPGGIGKTVVAAELARGLHPAAFANVFSVDLTQIADPARLIPGIVATLGAPAASIDSAATLASHLGTRPTLLLLDGCERLIQPVATLIDELRALIPGVHFLATSREPLRVRDEWVVRLPPLEVPASAPALTAAAALQYSAVRLFAQRAQECRHTFELRDLDVPVVAAICRRLDGNPLAIELAAACLDVLPLHSLPAHLHDVLKLLTRGRPDAASRHRSLRALLDWSHETLAPLEQVAWRRLAVIPASFDLACARVMLEEEGVQAPAVLDLMTELAAKSLLTTRLSGAKVLFTLPQISRAYALEKLASCRDNSAARFHYDSSEIPRAAGFLDGVRPALRSGLNDS